MRVLLVAGIFGADPAFRARALQQSGETLLFDGLRKRGVEVEARAPQLFDDWSDFDVVHVNHLTNASVRFLKPWKSSAPRVIFTRHSTKALPWHRRLVLAATYRAADRIVVMSHPEAELLPDGIQRERLDVIANGVDASSFPPRTRRRPDAGEPWQLLVVGQLIEFKRVHQAIELVGDLRRRGISAHLRIASHRDTLLRDLQRLSSELGVENSVEFLGPRTRAELGRDMVRAHFLVHPSRTEAQPTVVTEAALSGLPVHCYRVGGVADQLPHDWQLPEPADRERFTQLICDRMRDYESVTAIFSRHTPWAIREFSVDRMVDAHVALYSKCLARPV